MRCVVQLCQLCQARNVPFRIIKGTLSHDYFQLQNYHALETEYACFRIVSTAAHEELLPGFDVSQKVEWTLQLGRLLHGNLGWALLDLVLGHVAAALWHERAGHTPVLARMAG